MRKTLLAFAALLVAAPAFAQVVPGPKGGAVAPPSQPSVSPGPPLDQGPSPGSDRAFRGGGVILEGAPGAPAPLPRPLLPDRKPG